MKKNKLQILMLLFCAATLFQPLCVQAAQGDGTGGGGGNGTTPGPDAPPAAKDGGGPGGGIGPIKMLKPKMDQLYNWAEKNYPDLFPGHQTSIEIAGYYARFYPATNTYLGAKDLEVYVYFAKNGELLDAGSFKKLVKASGI